MIDRGQQHRSWTNWTGSWLRTWLRTWLFGGLFGLFCVLGLWGCVTEPMTEAGSDTDVEDSEDPAPTFGMPELPAVLSGRDSVEIAQISVERADDRVAVSGTVVERVSLLDGWLYQVQDETGRVWVLADGSNPQVGDSVTVEGTVRYEEIQVDGVNAGDVYLAETRYRAQ